MAHLASFSGKDVFYRNLPASDKGSEAGSQALPGNPLPARLCLARRSLLHSAFPGRAWERDGAWSDGALLGERRNHLAQALIEFHHKRILAAALFFGGANGQRFANLHDQA